jgi:hypothetical protein
MKVGTSRLKKNQIKKNKMEALKFTMYFVKTCNL